MSEASESRERILVVDDNEMNRDMLSRRLQRKGYHVDTAIGGREALEALAAESYDLVLLDIMMPDVDGFQDWSPLAGNMTRRNCQLLWRRQKRNQMTLLKRWKWAPVITLPSQSIFK